MSPVQRLRLVGVNASLKQRGVVLSLTPGDAPATGLVEVVDAVSRQRLKIQDELISHVLHIKRDDLKTLAGAADFDTWLADVQRIDRADEPAGYRVQYFSDDPQRPMVMFFCVTI
jgi:hypothetical protein